eukprot:jgi/Mesen1/3921/ME000209S02931
MEGGTGKNVVLLVTARAPSNIAVIKYWGKRNNELILPLNSSLSVTLDPDHLAATTTVAVSESFKEDRLWLNGKVSTESQARREKRRPYNTYEGVCRSMVQMLIGLMRADVDSLRSERSQAGLNSCLANVRQRATDVRDEETGVVITKEAWRQLKLHVASCNNFPTAAGLASSAAGFACLVYALAKLMGVEEAYPGELSSIARQGSGSACRSLYGGFVQWHRGEDEAGGKDSVAQQVVDEAHWPDLRIVIAVVSNKQKETSSTAGMQDSVDSSPLLRYRAAEVVPQRMRDMEAAVRGRDFAAFARLTCADSNQFHAVCLDTAPPIFYLTDTSRNYMVGDEEMLESAEAAGLYDDIDSLAIPSDIPEGATAHRWVGELQQIMCTRPGRGAHLLEKSFPHLLNRNTGMPQL